MIGKSYPKLLLWGSICLWSWGVFLHIHSVILSLSIGKLRPIILREIKDYWVLILLFFWSGGGGVLGFRIMLLFLLTFGKFGLSIAYVFVSVVTFLRLKCSFQYCLKGLISVYIYCLRLFFYGISWLKFLLGILIWAGMHGFFDLEAYLSRTLWLSEIPWRIQIWFW